MAVKQGSPRPLCMGTVQRPVKAQMTVSPRSFSRSVRHEAQEFATSNKFLADTDTAGPGTTF